MAVTVSTTNFASLTRSRNMAWTSAGVLWTCAMDSTTIRFFYSTDSGATWTENTSADLNTSGGNYFIDVSFVIDSDNHAHIFYVHWTATTPYLYYQRMANIGPATSWASAVTVATGTEGLSYSMIEPSAVAFPSGTGWKAFCTVFQTSATYPQIHLYEVTTTSGGSSSASFHSIVADYAYSATQSAGVIGMDFHHTTADPKAVQGSTPHLYIAYSYRYTSGASFYFTAYFRKYTHSAGTWSKGAERSLGSFEETSATYNPPATMLFDGSQAMVAVQATVDAEVNVWQRDGADTTTTALTSSSTASNPTLAGLCYDTDQNLWLIGSYSSSLRIRQWLRSTTTWQTNINIEAEALSDAKAEVATRTNGYALQVVYQGASNYLRFDAYDVPTAPTAPTWVTPVDFAGGDVGAALVLDWAFNDPNTGDTQGKYAVRRQIGAGTLYYWRASDSTWQLTETANVSATTALTLASGWGSDGDANHKYAVKTWDAGYLEGVYGAELTVVPSTPDLPTITTPADASTHVTSTLTAVWTVATQTTYLVELLNSAGTTTLWSSGTQTSTGTRSHAIAYTLLNGVSYKVRVTTANDEGLVGTADTNSFSVAYTGPAVPIVTVTSDTPTGAITVAHANLNPVGTQPTVTSADVYVRCTTGTYADGERPVGGNGIRVKTGLAPEVDWIDYAPASGRAYEYMVRVYGDNGTTTDSVWMSAAPDPALTLLLEATLWLDSAYSVADEQSVVNQGTGGAVLNARYGSTTGADTNDQLLLTHSAGGNYAYLPGVAGNYLSVPDEAALDITGDLEIVARVAVADNGLTRFLLGKWGGGDQRSFYISVQGGGAADRLMLATTPDGTYGSRVETSSTADPGFTADVALWVKITLDVDDGAGNRVTKFYTAADQATEPTSWTQLGSTVTTAGTTSIFAGTDAFQFGSIAAVNANAAGKYHRTIIRDGIGGSTVLDINCALDITDSDATSFVATTGQTVTVNRSTSGRKTVLVTRPVWLFGTDDYLEIPDNALLDFGATDSFTVLAAGRTWATFATNDALVAKKADNTNTTGGWALTAGSTAAQVAFDVGDGTAGAEAVTASRTSGVSYVTAGVRNVTTDTLTTYLNGTAGTPVTDTTTGTSANAEVMRIGRLSGAGTEYADTELLAVAVFRRALTQAEIANLVAYFEAG